MDLWELSDLATPWCIHVAATLRVADYLTSGAMPVSSLAAACGADPGALARVLRQLVSKGVFEEPSPDHFALNDAARGFLEDGMRLGLGLDGLGGGVGGAWAPLLAAGRAGRAGGHRGVGRPL